MVVILDKELRDEIEREVEEYKERYWNMEPQLTTSQEELIIEANEEQDRIESAIDEAEYKYGEWRPIKTKKEFNLSEKIIPYCWAEDIDEAGNKTKKADSLYEDETINIEDVKEFIRLLKENIKTDYEDVNECIIEEINKLAGKKLVGEK